MKYLIGLFFIAFSTLLQASELRTGAERTEAYISLLKGKKVGIVANHTAMVGNTHLVDTLLALGVDIKYIFAPEHGFRGTKSAGEDIHNSTDKKTGIKIISLYGATKAPSQEILKELDVVLFDIQDVGLRFYTYLSTLHYTMSEAGAAGKPVIVLDRPNPNGFYTDGPVLDPKYKSFVGIYPIPVVHGMTLGELAKMAVGERWLEKGVSCDLTVIPATGYTRKMFYSLPIAPSPNLPNMRSVYLYPDLCLFEATDISVGRGTDFPFQVFGSPALKDYSFSFTPRPNEGAVSPPQNGKLCYGRDLRTLSESTLRKGSFSLQYIIEAYEHMGRPQNFFTSFLEKLIGTDRIRTLIYEGKSAAQIAETWQKEVADFKIKRQPYLLYK